MISILIVGGPGTGKSFLGRELAREGVTYVELDRLIWRPKWQRIPQEEILDLLARVGDSVEPYVLDADLVGADLDDVPLHAARVVWLDLPRHIAVWRVALRTATIVAMRRDRWDGCRESIGHALGRDSVVWEVWRTFEARRRRYLSLYARRHWSDQWTVLRSRRATQVWLAGMTPI